MMRTNLFLFFLLAQLLSCQKEVEKTKPRYRPLTESVYASVTIVPVDEYTVYPTAGGLIEAIMIEEGQTVKKGQVLARISNNTATYLTENARLSVQLAQQNYQGKATVLQGIEDEIRAARLKLQADSADFVRQKNLWDKNIGSEKAFRDRKLAYELTRNNLDLLLNKYQRTKNELANQLQQLQNNFASTQTSNKDFTITAKMDGTIYALHKSVGEGIGIQEPLAIIGNSSDFLIEMQIDEVDIVRLQNGQKTLVVLDAYGDQTFEASIHRIYPQKDNRTQTFKVEALFDKPPNKLYPGLSGEANIVVNQKEQAMTIPPEYLLDDGRVQTVNGPVNIETGVQNISFVEVLSGIDTSTYLIKPQ